MQTIQARISTKLLSKASRLFTGTLDGRIIEILQNARRAGATQVEIFNTDGLVTVHDNGCGIEDFSKLLELGDSNWDEAMERAEDPAGVGLFSLAPRQVTVFSGDRKLCITEKAWTGELVAVLPTDDSVKGTMLLFKDEPWELSEVEKHAVFTDMAVVVDGQKCATERFCSEDAVLYPGLGCKIEVREKSALNKWHGHFRRGYYCNDILVNFHGQVIVFSYSPVSDEQLTFLVDMTGDATEIRLMLPARTKVFENKAFEQLKAAIEVEAYRFIQRRGSHKLPFEQYKRAEQLGIRLPESEPVFSVGLLSGDTPEPIEVTKPQDFPLSKCYRFNPDRSGNDDSDEANIHLLAAMGKFKEPFVPVEVPSFYDGYSWADLPTVDKVEVTVGKELGRQWLCSEAIVAVDSLKITAHTSDGNVFESEVLMAVLEQEKKDRTWANTNVYLTPGARQQLEISDIWHHCDGWNEDGDTYETQLYEFEEQLEHFWSTIIGIGEYLRSKIRQCLFGIVKDWQRITIEADETISILYKDGAEKVFKSSDSESTT